MRTVCLCHVLLFFVCLLHGGSGRATRDVNTLLIPRDSAVQGHGCRQPTLKVLDGTLDYVYVCDDHDDNGAKGWRRFSSCHDQCSFQPEGWKWTMICELNSLHDCWLSSGYVGEEFPANDETIVQEDYTGEDCHGVSDGLYIRDGDYMVCRQGRQVTNVTEMCELPGPDDHVCVLSLTQATLSCPLPLNPVSGLFCAELDASDLDKMNLSDGMSSFNISRKPVPHTQLPFIARVTRSLDVIRFQSEEHSDAASHSLIRKPRNVQHMKRTRRSAQHGNILTRDVVTENRPADLHDVQKTQTLRMRRRRQRGPSSMEMENVSRQLNKTKRIEELEKQRLLELEHNITADLMAKDNVTIKKPVITDVSKDNKTHEGTTSVQNLTDEIVTADMATNQLTPHLMSLLLDDKPFSLKNLSVSSDDLGLHTQDVNNLFGAITSQSASENVSYTDKTNGLFTSTDITPHAAHISLDDAHPTGQSEKESSQNATQQKQKLKETLTPQQLVTMLHNLTSLFNPKRIHSSSEAQMKVSSSVVTSQPELTSNHSHEEQLDDVINHLDHFIHFLSKVTGVQRNQVQHSGPEELSDDSNNRLKTPDLHKKVDELTVADKPNSHSKTPNDEEDFNFQFSLIIEETPPAQFAEGDTGLAPVTDSAAKTSDTRHGESESRKHADRGLLSSWTEPRKKLLAAQLRRLAAQRRSGMMKAPPLLSPLLELLPPPPLPLPPPSHQQLHISRLLPALLTPPQFHRQLHPNHLPPLALPPLPFHRQLPPPLRLLQTNHLFPLPLPLPLLPLPPHQQLNTDQAGMGDSIFNQTAHSRAKEGEITLDTLQERPKEGTLEIVKLESRNIGAGYAGTEPTHSSFMDAENIQLGESSVAEPTPKFAATSSSKAGNVDYKGYTFDPSLETSIIHVGGKLSARPMEQSTPNIQLSSPRLNVLQNEDKQNGKSSLSSDKTVNENPSEVHLNLYDSQMTQVVSLPGNKQSHDKNTNTDFSVFNTSRQTGNSIHLSIKKRPGIVEERLDDMVRSSSGKQTSSTDTDGQHIVRHDSTYRDEKIQDINKSGQETQPLSTEVKSQENVEEIQELEKLIGGSQSTDAKMNSVLWTLQTRKNNADHILHDVPAGTDENKHLRVLDHDEAMLESGLDRWKPTAPFKENGQDQAIVFDKVEMQFKDPDLQNKASRDQQSYSDKTVAFEGYPNSRNNDEVLINGDGSSPTDKEQHRDQSVSAENYQQVNDFTQQHWAEPHQDVHSFSKQNMHESLPQNRQDFDIERLTGVPLKQQNTGDSLSADILKNQPIKNGLLLTSMPQDQPNKNYPSLTNMPQNQPNKNGPLLTSMLQNQPNKNIPMLSQNQPNSNGPLPSQNQQITGDTLFSDLSRYQQSMSDTQLKGEHQNVQDASHAELTAQVQSSYPLNTDDLSVGRSPRHLVFMPVKKMTEHKINPREVLQWIKQQGDTKRAVHHPHVHSHSHTIGHGLQ